MSISIQLPKEVEHRLKEKAAQFGQTVEAFLQQVAEREAHAGNGMPTDRLPSELTREQWSAEWRAWAASHRPTPGVLDDSRESIYVGRGE